MSRLGSSAVATACISAAAATVIAPYVLGWLGWPVVPVVVAVLAVLAAALPLLLQPPAGVPGGDAPAWAWLAVVGGGGLWLAAPTWPLLLPPGGGSDLTHHLMLIDVLERTGQLVDGAVMGGALGEMAHYTPGLHLAAVVVGSLAGVDAWRTVYPLVLVTVALKAGFVFLIAHRLLTGVRGRLPGALAAVAFVLFVPRSYSLGGFMQSGYLAQVAAEVFVVAGWWALTEWRASRASSCLALTGVSGAAAFLVWPIWTGPLVVTAAALVLLDGSLSRGARARALLLVAAPLAVVTALHLSRHAAWLRMAGTSGAVPAFEVDAAWWVLVALAVTGLAAWRAAPAARPTVVLVAALAAQAAALLAVAASNGAETPYMAVKMTYLAAYPLAVLAAAGLTWGLSLRLRRWGGVADWTAMALVWIVGARLAAGFAVPAPLVSLDLFAAGHWARANLPPDEVEYVVASGDTAYWLHLAVLGQPRASARTAELDHFAANGAIGRWIDGTSLEYGIAEHALLPREVRERTDEVRRFGQAVVIRRRSPQDRGAAAASATPRR